MLSVRQYLERTRSVVEEIRRRNRDLSDLLDFTSGLSVRAHDERALAAYAQEAIGRLAATDAVVVTGADAPGGIPLVTGGARVGTLHLQLPLADAALPRLRPARPRVDDRARRRRRGRAPRLPPAAAMHRGRLRVWPSWEAPSRWPVGLQEAPGGSSGHPILRRPAAPSCLPGLGTLCGERWRGHRSYAVRSRPATRGLRPRRKCF